jgi:hypothetical protein
VPRLSRLLIVDDDDPRLPGGAKVTALIVFHDGRDWAIEKREGGYWCLPLNVDEWQKGLPAGMTVADLDLFLPAEVESTQANKVKELSNETSPLLDRLLCQRS